MHCTGQLSMSPLSNRFGRPPLKELKAVDNSLGLVSGPGLSDVVPSAENSHSQVTASHHGDNAAAGSRK